MSETNLYRALRELIPEPPLQVATVSSVDNGTGASLVAWPGGSQELVRGTQAPIGARVFVRAGVIEGTAPELDLIEIDV